jgi:hypothetical protein
VPVASPDDLGQSASATGPSSPTGTWQRCVTFAPTNINIGGSGSYTDYTPDTRCDVVGPDLHPWGVAFNDPPTHIDN